MIDEAWYTKKNKSLSEKRVVRSEKQNKANNAIHQYS
uniref:Uncharacterized protein n=1 Tax=Rhizophora mucronata TaxID=61149 RepID=A0A2P2PYT7_RHIMU